jgi:hypothetical protein
MSKASDLLNKINESYIKDYPPNKVKISHYEYDVDGPNYDHEKKEFSGKLTPGLDDKLGSVIKHDHKVRNGRYEWPAEIHTYDNKTGNFKASVHTTN